MIGDNMSAAYDRFSRLGATKKQLWDAIYQALAAYEAWMAADGMFPDPEYDEFQNAMNALSDVAGIDTFAMIEATKQRMASKDDHTNE